MKILSFKVLKLAAILMILLLAAYLRFWNLEKNPGWYSDEATHIEIARNLLQSENRYFAVGESYLLFARLPLFEYSLAAVFKLFGAGMLSLRAFTASLGLLTVVLLYWLLRDISQNDWLALAAALAYTLIPQAILYNRFGFSYNLLSPLIVLALWGAVRYSNKAEWRYLALMSLCIGSGTISEFLMWSFLPLLLFVGKNWRDRVFALLLALLPLALYCIWQLLTIPDAFLFDLGYSLGRTGGGTLMQQAARLAENLSILLSDVWWMLALVGIFLLRERVLRRILLLFLLPLILIARTVPLYSLSAYYTLPFFPILAIGIGAFFFYGLPFAWEKLRENFWRIVALGVSGILLLPLVYISYKEIEKVQNQYPTAIDAFLLNPNDVLNVVDYLESNSRDDAIILTTPPIGALVDRRAVDFQMAVVAAGQDAIHIPHDLDPQRFVYSADYRQADFVVVDNLWRNWGAVHIPIIGAILTDVESWEMVFQSGAIRVYRNPQQ